MNKRVRKGGLNKTWCIVLRNVAKGVVFFDSPTVKRLEHVSKKNESILTEAFG